MRAPVVLALCSAWYLTGLSWTVGLVVYPSFSKVGPDRWAAFHRQHMRQITWAVGPAWALQGLALVWWLLDAPTGTLGWAAGAGACAVGTVVLTVAVAVQRHQELERGFDEATATSLLRTHHVRSVLWTASALLATLGLVPLLR
jgi:hypothetical protein